MTESNIKEITEAMEMRRKSKSHKQDFII